MISHGASLVLVQVAKGLGTMYALLGLAAFLHFSGDFKYSPPRVRDKNVFVDELRLSLNEPMVGRETNMTWMETVSWSPRAAIVHNFLTDDECGHLIDLRKDNVTESEVEFADGTDGPDKDRTSSGAWLDYYESKIIYSVREKVALMTSLPGSLQESPYLLRYNHGEKYAPHFDDLWRYRLRPFGPEGSDRVLTVLLYLSDVEAGGETNFPQGRLFRKKSQEMARRSTKCSGPARTALPVKKGNALLFWSKDPISVIVDEASLHEGCPVMEGTKWSMTIWIHDYIQWKQRTKWDFTGHIWDDEEDMKKMMNGKPKLEKRGYPVWVPCADRYY